MSVYLLDSSIKLQHRRSGESEEAFDEAIREIRRMLKNHKDGKLKFAIDVTISDPALEPQADQTALRHLAVQGLSDRS